jgi:hypothetical protein
MRREERATPSAPVTWISSLGHSYDGEEEESLGFDKEVDEDFDEKIERPNMK